MRKTSERRAERWLDQALLGNLVIHAIAMGVMALLLLPFMPGGPIASDTQRMLRIAAHPWLFRLGWLPWQLCAAADLWLAAALLRARFVPRAPAVLVLVLTAIAVVPDQGAQALWITRGVALAQRGDLRAYLSFERPTFALTAGWGAAFYTLAALGWTWCFAGARTWNRALSILSVPLWGTMLIVSTAPLLPAPWQLRGTVIAAGNALGFTLMLLWLALVTEQVLRRGRPPTAHGRYAPYVHPGTGPLSRAVDILAKSRLLRALGEWLPVPGMRSDIRDVVYVNYLVPAERLRPLVPEGLELQRLGPGGVHALFTFLTYRHGHFGFSFMGPLRRLLPSPVQSNWRIHVRDPRTGLPGIYFVTTAITSALYSLCARVLAEGLPMHVPRHGEVLRGEDGTIRLALDPGTGTAPDATATLHPAAAPALTGPWAQCFSSFREFLGYCVPQDRALSSQPFCGHITFQEIELAIPVEACEPLSGEVSSRAAVTLCGQATPLCFRVPQATFRFVREWHAPL